MCQVIQLLRTPRGHQVISHPIQPLLCDFAPVTQSILVLGQEPANSLDVCSSFRVAAPQVLILLRGAPSSDVYFECQGRIGA